jgi:hypothetical protein
MTKTEKYFRDKEIVKGKNAKALTILSNLIPNFFESNDIPSEYVNEIWAKFHNMQKSDNSINGKIFEYLLITVLVKHNILPVYVQAKVAFVPNVEFDLLLYTGEGPIALSIKTSLRERYKQADLEAIALKYVHRKAKCYLLTMNAEEAKNVNEKIKSGDVIGIDEVIHCASEKFDEFVSDLKRQEFKIAGQIEIVTAAAVVSG